ncbi:MAG: T9SS type A sorting domain-containing protein [Bacteroidota bacterium]
MNAPTATDNCSGTITATTADPLTYSTPGTYIIHWNFDDGHGNISTQAQTIIVKDNEIPVITTNGDNTLTNDAGKCGATVIVNATAVDNCGVNAPSGVRSDGLSLTALYPVGTTTITWSVTDMHGNAAIPVTQTIIVTDSEIPVITSNGNISVNNDLAKCSAIVAVSASATDNCSVGTPSGVRSDALALTDPYPVGTTTITWNVTDIHGNAATPVLQTIIVKDNTAPVPAVTILPTITGQCSATVTAPTALDNCAGTVYGTTVNATTYNAQGTYTVTWTFADGNGNTSTQNQTVIVKDNMAPVPTIATLPTITGQCSATVTDVPTALDNCAGMINATVYTIGYITPGGLLVITGRTINSNSFTGQGTYIINWIFDDGNGNTISQDQMVIVKDNTAPVPTVASLPTITGQCSVTVTAPTAIDNCAGTVTGTTVNPTSYNAQGTYAITWTFADGNGNTSTQNQTVIVKDNMAPVPTVTTLPAITGQCSATVTGAPTALDNCAGIVYGTTVNPTTYHAQGTYTVTWTFADGNGNTSTQNQTVIVKDNTAPSITCPANITIACGLSALPTLTGTATATDNCSGSITIAYSDVANSNGISRTWKATDAAGNSSTCVQTITQSPPFTTTISSLPTSNVYTGGIATNLYLGYGAQSTVLRANTPTGNAYTYAWSGNGSGMLSSTTNSNPVFTPTSAGSYLFTVVATNNLGCKSTAYISICVTDVRVPGSNGKVYICHLPPGNSANRQTLSISVNAVDAHLGNHAGDRLGSCDQSPCNKIVTASSEVFNSKTAKVNVDIATSTEEALKVTVMPNPSTGYFTLKLESKYQTPVELRVMDARGRVVDAKSKLGANSTFQIGYNYSSGTYYAELIQGTKRKVVQLVKGRG